jgi:hypothetical protein
MPRSTIYGVLRRHGLSRLREADRTCGAPVRYQARFPGELLHLDVKKLGRIPDGGGRMTDRAFCYTASAAFAEALAAIGARHRPTRPYRPQENGKAERFIGTMISERAYARLCRSNEERRRALPRWLYTYDQRRPHTALGGLPPMVVLVNKVGGNDS